MADHRLAAKARSPGAHLSGVGGWHHGVNRRSSSRGWLAPTLLGSAAALGAAALFNSSQAGDAEHKHPPFGRFMTVDGVRLHYIDYGQGDPVVLIHGNGTLIQDFTVSGLVERLASRHRVIVIDRPGYGYSERPRRLWTPRAHAQLFETALERLGVEQAVVFGHSWGTLVGVALALRSPALVRGLVLASGYYFPTARLDVPLLSPPAIPVIGDVMRHTVSPLVARLTLPLFIRRMFQPAPVPERFNRLFPKELMLRPSQLRASAEDAALMVPAAMELQHHYRELQVPVVIVTGADDRVADVGRQSHRLHRELPGSTFIAIPGLGHMVHYLAADQVVGAIDHAAHQADTLRREPRSPVSHSELRPASSDGMRAEEPARVGEAQTSGPGSGADDRRSGDTKWAPIGPLW